MGEPVENDYTKTDILADLADASYYRSNNIYWTSDEEHLYAIRCLMEANYLMLSAILEEVRHDHDG